MESFRTLNKTECPQTIPNIPAFSYKHGTYAKPSILGSQSSAFASYLGLHEQIKRSNSLDKDTTGKNSVDFFVNVHNCSNRGDKSNLILDSPV